MKITKLANLGQRCLLLAAGLLGLASLPNARALTLAPGDIVATSDYSGGSLILIHPATGEQRLILRPIDSECTVGGIVCTTSGKIYFTAGYYNEAGTQFLRTLFRVDLTAGQPPALVAVTNLPSGTTRAIALDTDGKIIVLSGTTVLRIDPANGVMSTVSQGNLLTNPFDLDVEPSGNIVVSGGGKIVRIDGTSGVQSVLTTGGVLKTGQGIKVNKSNGDIYVLDQVPDCLIRVAPATGEQTTLFSGNHFNTERTIACDDQNMVYVTPPFYALDLAAHTQGPLPTPIPSFAGNFEQITVWKAPAVEILSPLESWRYRSFGTSSDSGPAANDADPDGDGLPNLTEYASGSDPTVPTTPTWSIALGQGPSGQELTMEHPYAPGAAAEVLCSVEWTEDLESGVWDSDGSRCQIGMRDERSVLLATVPAGTGTRRFLRIRFTLR